MLDVIRYLAGFNSARNSETPNLLATCLESIAQIRGAHADSVFGSVLLSLLLYSVLACLYALF